MATMKNPTTKKKLPRVIIRTTSAGVHYGHLVSRKGKEVQLTQSRRIWYWHGAASLSQLATEGCDNQSKIGVPIDVILTEAIEIITCTGKGAAVMEGMQPWRA